VKHTGTVDESIEVDAANELVPSHESLTYIYVSAIGNGVPGSVRVTLPAVTQGLHGRKWNSGGFANNNAHWYSPLKQ